LANREYLSFFDGPFEIVSLVGTIAINGPHIHIALSDGNGTTLGGHLPSLSERKNTDQHFN
jgi:uncharacterized protein